MEITVAGHSYKLDYLDGEDRDGCWQGTLNFLRRDDLQDKHGGAQNQEVLRVLISRMHYLQSQLSCEENVKILYYLRAALLEHEIRVLRRKLEKGQLRPEDIAIGSDGHFIFALRGGAPR